MINEKYAKARGYEFHGAYSWNHDEIKKRAVEIRKQGNKAMIVYSPGSKYSRGGGGGYSVYWIESEANKAARAAARKEQYLKGLYYKREQLLKEVSELNVQIEQAEKGAKV